MTVLTMARHVVHVMTVVPAMSVPAEAVMLLRMLVMMDMADVSWR